MGIDRVFGAVKLVLNRGSLLLSGTVDCSDRGTAATYGRSHSVMCPSQIAIQVMRGDTPLTCHYALLDRSNVWLLLHVSGGDRG